MAPGFDETVRLAMGSDRVLLDRNGQVLQTLRTDFAKRRLPWQPLKSFPESLRLAVMEAEDQRFRRHPGVDPIGLGRAIVANFRSQRVQGASTITMQVTDLIQPETLVRNRPIPKRSILHKLHQLWRALSLEVRWSKDQILEAYLNLIHLRGEYQGVAALSHAYLKKDPIVLDLDESAVVAALISSPNQSVGPLKRRACQLRQKLESPAEDCARVEAVAEALVAAVPGLPAQVGQAPHAARRVFTESRVPIVHSTLDGRLQADVVAILEKNIQRLKASNVNDSAAIVIDNVSGEVLAYVGGVPSSSKPHVDGLLAHRQAGSSLKSFLYAKAIDLKLLTAASILLDDPTAISWGDTVYRPTNYDKQFSGPVSVREALGSSLNVPAVKAVTIIGLHRSYQTLVDVGLTGLREPDYYGVSLALGAVEVRLDELANAYRIFANRGRWSPLTLLPTRVPATAPSRDVFSPQTSYILGSILSDPDARAIGFGWDSPLETPFWTAVKTGTSKDYRDNWCVGFSSRYTVGVWVGNFDATAMNKVSGVSGAGPSWYEIMSRIHANEPSVMPSAPDGVVRMEIRHSWVSHPRREVFIQGTEPASALIEPALDKRPQFVFPAEGSVLVRHPHLDASRLALFVRFKGTVPEKSRLLWDGKDLGDAVSPFRIESFTVGTHELAIRTPEGEVLTRVKFRVKGADGLSPE